MLDPTLNMSNKFPAFDIFSLREAYINRAISVTSVIDEVLNRIKICKDYNVWISLQSPERLWSQAKQLEQQDPKTLPLYGIPFAVKDNIDCYGLPTTAACPGFAYLPEKTAFVVQRLIDAGAILIGKTNMDQFATGLTGTRSPDSYGICKNALNPDYISGGSSSGSAVAVALNLVSFALGTDTAGSGRIPAAFNNIVGLKPSRGLLSSDGVVPACRSLDCVSLFCQTSAQAEYIFALINQADSNDIYGRDNRALAEPYLPNSTRQYRFGIPKPEQLNYFGDAESGELFQRAIESLKPLGEVVEIDFQPFLDAASLLYDGPWIAERYSGLREFVESNSKQIHPVVYQILSNAKQKNAIDTFTALHQLQALKQQTYKLLSDLSCIVVPTAPTIYRIAEVLAEPIRLNSQLGYYTNYMNLLDLSALALPFGFYRSGLPFGVTLFAPALADLRLLSLGKIIESSQSPKSVAVKTAAIDSGYRRIAVCGAHMQGLPLNTQLQTLGGRFFGRMRTAPNYRMYLLTAIPPERPGLFEILTQDKRLI
ncbi:allophanate hydrolase [Methylocucumis oryzae]|uniref:allophanate hydrolase n=1 Tax=Methylocucumis oryzae TaxID=1632867 RepID=UPI000B0FE858|nr:allophanate hydrolase [Methylocucumis oryzae]